MQACRFGHWEVVQTLLVFRCNVSAAHSSPLPLATVVEDQWPQVARFNPFTNVTLRHILGDFPLHSRPPQLLSEVLIHFVAARMDGIPREMSLIKDPLSKLQIFRYQ